MYPKNTLGYTSGYSRIQKYVCILPRTPEYMTDYRIHAGYKQNTCILPSTPEYARIQTEYTKRVYSFFLPICEPGWHLLTCPAPRGQGGPHPPHHSSQAAPQERAAVLGVAASYYLPWSLASSKPSSAAA